MPLPEYPAAGQAPQPNPAAVVLVTQLRKQGMYAPMANMWAQSILTSGAKPDAVFLQRALQDTMMAKGVTDAATAALARRNAQSAPMPVQPVALPQKHGMPQPYTDRPGRTQ